MKLPALSLCFLLRGQLLLAPAPAYPIRIYIRHSLLYIKRLPVAAQRHGILPKKTRETLRQDLYFCTSEASSKLSTCRKTREKPVPTRFQ